jgi:primosomal protein N' (replication factor Y)
VHLLVRDRIRERAAEAAAGLARELVAHPLCRSVRLLGPAPAAFERLRGHWRYQLLLRATSGNLLRALLAEVVPARPGFDLTVDVDPYQLL